jgi:hypothetical protein
MEEFTSLMGITIPGTRSNLRDIGNIQPIPTMAHAIQGWLGEATSFRLPKGRGRMGCGVRLRLPSLQQGVIPFDTSEVSYFILWE